MEFQLSDEQKMMVETAQRVGQEFGLEYWARKDKEKAFPAECWRAVCQAGLGGANLPEQYGGSGLGMLELALITETLAATGAGSTIGQLFMINPIFGGVGVSQYGSDAMRETLLPRLCEGDLNFCMALTEPDAGSNTLAMKTFAHSDGDGWRLRGQKIWITAVDVAEKMLVVARTKRSDEIEKPTQGISLFLIDTERDGLSYTPIEKLGTNTLTSSSVFFDDVEVRSDELIGTLHEGWKELLEVLNTERIITTAGLVGAGRLAIELAVGYAQDRRVFGSKPISAYQGLQFPLAQAHAEMRCAQLMNYQAAWKCDRGLPYGSEANVAKLLAAQGANHAIERAMQTLGGMGYAREYHIERLWRDARLFKFAPVSEEMILNFIAVHDLGMARSY